ncbi:MAG: hypothetical protein OXC38_03715 [Gammaproteobacteria bacterium]|nr:hypothetical protein [Gammaproteobacteria bacterium]
MIRKILGWALIVTAVTVAVHTVIEPLYHVSEPGQPYSPLWEPLDLLMALAWVVGLVFASLRKRAVDREGGETVTREYLAANVLFYGFLAVGILFLWSYFSLLNPSYSPAGPDTASILWMLIDATLPLLFGAMGVNLLRNHK